MIRWFLQNSLTRASSQRKLRKAAGPLCVSFERQKTQIEIKKMNVNISPIIQASELLKLYKSENLIIVDVSNGKNAKSNYETKHLEGAIFVDLNTQLAEIKDDLSIGGRHPLPKIENYAKT